MQASPAAAEAAFGFLANSGFTLRERWVTGGNSFRDGWRLTFTGPRTDVVLEYLDMQFEVRFIRDGIEATYLVLDRDLHGRRSGYDGDMFPPEKLEAAILRIAQDIREHYGSTLSGEDHQWDEIARLKANPHRDR